MRHVHVEGGSLPRSRAVVSADERYAAMDSPLMGALQTFEAAEANLVKLERIWAQIESLIPDGISFGDDPEYEDRCREVAIILDHLPKIDDWKPDVAPLDLNVIAQDRFDALEVGELEARLCVENEIVRPGKEIREYRFRFDQKRRALIRDALVELIDMLDASLGAIRQELGHVDSNKAVSGQHWDTLRNQVDQIDVLLGSSVQRPPRWSDLRRHLHFGQVGDFNDIERMDWPKVKEGLRTSIYGVNEPLPIDIEDLSDLVALKPRGPISTKLNWSKLSASEFERLIFALICAEVGYENPEWLMRTNTPDRGRDLSVIRVVTDRLSGTFRHRVLIQCKHWLGKSVTLADVATVKEQMKLWGEPRVDVLILATSGRFTADAVQWIEKHNASDSALRVEMWPESHLERLLASRPDLIAEFALR